MVVKPINRTDPKTLQELPTIEKYEYDSYKGIRE